jgi:hypothetical protein
MGSAGDLGRAIPLYEQALADSERVLSADHPSHPALAEQPRRRTGRTAPWAPRRWPRRRLSGSPSGPPVPCRALRPAPRSTPPAAPAWSRPAHRPRTARTGTGTRPAPRRTRAARPRCPSHHQVLTRRPHRRAPPLAMLPPPGLLLSRDRSLCRIGMWKRFVHSEDSRIQVIQFWRNRRMKAQGLLRACRDGLGLAWAVSHPVVVPGRRSPVSSVITGLGLRMLRMIAAKDPSGV